MNKEAIINSIKKVRELSKKRNFDQTFDLVINLKEIDLKKSEENINTLIPLPFPKGKKPKVCAFVGPELQTSAKALFDKTILTEEFPKYSDKKLIKQLASQFDYFIAQANIMPNVATTFGKVLGPKQKMPNPKFGCVVPPTADLKPLAAKLEGSVRLQTKNEPILKCAVGKESMKDEEIQQNILTIYNNIAHSLPREEGNIGSVYLKLTMNKPLKITNKGPVVKEEKKIDKPEIKKQETRKETSKENKEPKKEEDKESKKEKDKK